MNTDDREDRNASVRSAYGAAIVGSWPAVDGPARGALLARERTVRPLHPTNLVAWADAERRRGEVVAAWFDPEGGLAWAASGSCESTQADSWQAFDAFRSQTAERAVRPPPEGRPWVALGGRFDGERPPGAPWEAWPGAWAFVPRRLLVLRGGEATVVVHGGDADDLDAALEALAEAAAGAARAAPGAPAGTRGRPASPASSAAAFRARVAAATAAIAAGDLEKVVVARAERHDLEAGRAWDVAGTLERLRAEAPAAITFLAAPAGPRAGALVGATPEVLVRVDGRQVLGLALAGTTRRARGDGEDGDGEDAALAAALLADPKARREHGLVVDAVRAALRPACLALDAPGDPTVRRLPHVQHLETRVRGVLRAPGGALDLAARLHPTPALGGAPRAAALAWLRAHEALDRGAYAAPVGWLDAAGGGALAAALRCALLRGASAWAFAGAGVVAGSDPAAEWEETALKLRTVERALAARDTADARSPGEAT